MDYFEMANECFKQGNYIEALSYYEKSIEYDLNYGTALYNMGVCYIKLQEHEKAIKIFTKVLNLKNIHKRTISNSFFNLGYSYCLLGDLGKAYQFIARSWCINPTDHACKKALNLIEKRFLKLYDK